MKLDIQDFDEEEEYQLIAPNPNDLNLYVKNSKKKKKKHIL